MQRFLCKFFSIAIFALSPLVCFAQTCTTEQQWDVDACIIEAAAACEQTIAPKCWGHVELLSMIFTRFQENCCCKNGALAGETFFMACRTKTVSKFKKVKSLFSQSGEDILRAIQSSRYEACDIPCDY